MAVKIQTSFLMRLLIRGIGLIFVFFLFWNCSVSTNSGEEVKDSTDQAFVNQSITLDSLYSFKRVEFYEELVNRIYADGTIIRAYERSYEHSSERISYLQLNEFKLLDWKSRVEESTDTKSFIFKNNSLVAVYINNDEEQKLTEDQDGYPVEYARNINLSSGIPSDTKSSASVSSKLPFTKIRLSQLDDSGVDECFARFDPRMPEQELLGEPSEADLIWRAKEDSIKQLTNLNLSDQKLSDLPQSAIDRLDFTHVELSGNKLKSVPAQLWQLDSLVSLDLSGNQLKIIPVEIAKFRDLKELYLDNNELKSLPIEIAKIPNLKFLSLSGNQFTDKQKGEIRSWFSDTNCIVTFTSVLETYQ